jgi:hypothetical protein
MQLSAQVPRSAMCDVLASRSCDCAEAPLRAAGLLANPDGPDLERYLPAGLDDDLRIDNGAPARVAVGIERGDAWRNSNDFVLTWTNPPEGDRAPIAAAIYELCPAAGGACTQREQAREGIASVPVQVPGPGEWTVSVWRRDAAGNADQAVASDPVTLRYDPEPPRVVFDALSASDPTLVTAPVTDNVSGLASGAIEISAAGSNVWQTLDTRTDGSRLVARIDDAVMPAGAYLLRATAQDQAGNQASTNQRSDGQQMAVTLPLRIPSTLQAGFVHRRVVKQVVRRNGKRRTIRRRVTELKPRGVIRFGRQRKIAGRLTNRDGQGVPGAEIQVLAHSGDAAARGRGADRRVRSVQLHGRREFESHAALRLRRLAAHPSRAGQRPPRRPGNQHATGQPPSRAQRPARDVHGPSSQPANPARRKARPATGPAVQALADLPHCADGSDWAVGRPLPLQAHPRRAVVPLPRRAATRGGLRVRRGGLEIRERPCERALLTADDDHQRRELTCSKASASD